MNAGQLDRPRFGIAIRRFGALSSPRADAEVTVIGRLTAHLPFTQARSNCVVVFCTLRVASFFVLPKVASLCVLAQLALCFTVIL